MLRRLLPWLWCLLLSSVLFGCAVKRPGTVPLSPEQLHTAESLWYEFLAKPGPQVVDADVRIGWDVLGSKGNVDGIMQAQQPALLKLSAIDPLGRTVFMLTTDGETFSFTDVRQQTVYQGSVLSQYWQKYLPEEVKPADIFALLAGQGPQGGGRLIQSRGDADHQGFWYELLETGGTTRHIQLDGSGQRMLSQLLADRDGTIVLEVSYSGYLDSDTQVSWPAATEVRGRGLHGSYTLNVQKIYSHQRLPSATFEPRYPPHFEIIPVE